MWKTPYAGIVYECVRKRNIQKRTPSVVRRFSACNEKGENTGEGVKRGKRRGRESGLAFVPAARLRVKLLLIGYRRLKVGMWLRIYSLVWYVGRSGENKNI